MSRRRPSLVALFALGLALLAGAGAGPARAEGPSTDSTSARAESTKHGDSGEAPSAAGSGRTRAAPHYPRGFGGFTFGVFIPSSPDLESQGSYAYSVVLGAMFKPSVGAELEIGYHKTHVPYQPGLLRDLSDVSVSPLVISMVLEQPLGAVTGRLMAGGGMYYVQLPTSDETESHFDPGYELGAGLSLGALGIEARYQSVTTTMLAKDLAIRGVVVDLYLYFGSPRR